MKEKLAILILMSVMPPFFSLGEKKWYQLHTNFIVGGSSDGRVAKKWK